MNAIQQFNALNGREVSRSEIEKILQTAKQQNAVDVVYRISKILNENPHTKRFEVNITEFEIEPVSQEFLAGVHFEEIQEEIGGLNGLAAGVSPEQIYQMITKKMIQAMRSASGKDYKKTWHGKKVYTIPYNFVSKKPYRGINYFMLKQGNIYSYLENPYFLTFKQIEKLGGKLKKASKGHQVIYYTNLYLVKKEGKTIFGAYNYDKIKKYLDENNLSKDDVRTYPILRYYNVFNGSDIEGIDFKLDEAKIVSVQNQEDENPYGDSIVKHYQTCPEIRHRGDKAYYSPSKDFVQMPEKEAFITSNDYFRTLFHELAHSTGHPKRLNREMGGKFGSKKYAFEELIAEFTAVFVSAHAGIIWYSNKNHAEYLKNWSKVIGEMEKDSKFIVRAAAQAQRAADYILNFDQNGEPAFYKDLFKEEKTSKKTSSVENQKDTKGKTSGKQTIIANKATEKLFVKLLLPLYVKRKNNPRKFTGHNDDSPENFRVQDADFWAKFTDVNTDLFKTKASKKLVKITEKGFDVLEKHAGNKQSKNKTNLDDLYQQYSKGNSIGFHLLMEDTAKKFKIHKTEAFAFWSFFRLGLSKDIAEIPTASIQIFYNIFGKELNKHFFTKYDVGGNYSRFPLTDFSKEIRDFILKRKNWKKYTQKQGLSAPQTDLFSGLCARQLALTTDDFKKMSVPELRAFTLQYYLTHLKGKKVAVKNFIKEVIFTTKAGRKIAHGEAMYKEKAVVIEHLEELIKNSTYNNWGDRKPQDNENILGYLNFKSKLTIDGEKRHIRISFIFNKDRELKLKSYDVGKKKSGKVSQGVLPSAEETLPLSDRKITKNSENSKQKPKKSGLSAPQLSLTTEDFKKMSVKELRAFTLQYYLTHLKGKKVALKNFIKEVVFTTKAGRKIAHGEAMYKEKAVVIEHLEELIKNSTYNNWGDRKPQDNENILGYLNFKSKLTIDGEKRHIRIAVILDKSRNFELKSFDVGKKKNSRASKGALPSAEEAQLFDRKITKKSENTKQKPKKSGLCARQLALTTEDFKKMSVKELRAFTLQYYNENLKGKTAIIKKYLKEVVFTSQAGRKITKGEAMYSAKAVAVQYLQELIENSTYNNWGNRKASDNKDVLGYLNFKSKLTIDGEKRHLRISLTMFKNRKTELKNIEVGNKKKLVKSTQASMTNSETIGFNQLSDRKITKKSENSKQKPKKSGLCAPETFSEETKTPLKVVTNERNLAQKMASRPTEWEFFRIDNPQMANFLGKVEKKAKDSVVITLTGGQGSGKTRFAFQFINDLAQNYSVGHISNEEQPDSSLYYDKVQQYLNQNALQNVEPYDVRSLSELDEVIERNEIIVIDSFQKIKELDPKFEVDKDLRKKYDGKLFLVIFQQTSDGKMRGGSKSQFDGDIILLTKKFDDYRENFVYPDKNRYNSVPANELKYSIFHQKLLKEGETEVVSEVLEDNLSFDVV